MAITPFAKECSVANRWSCANVLKEPEPRVRFRKFSSSGLKLQLLCWIFKPAIRGRTVDAINTDIYKTFSKKNIIIPFPTVNLISNKDS